MTSWATFWLTLAVLVPAGIAGCVAPVTPQGDPSPVPSSPPPAEEEAPPVCDDCCDADCVTPMGSSTTTPCLMSDDPREPYRCVPYEPAPILGNFSLREIAACAECASVQVAVRDSTLLLATEQGLLVIKNGVEALLVPTPVLEGLPPGPTSSPSLHLDASGRAWFAALEGEGARRSVFVGAWSKGDAWEITERVGVQAAPMLPLVERAWIVHARGATVLVLASADAAWALRSPDEGKTFGRLDTLTQPFGRSVVGAPYIDAKERVLLPFLSTQTNVGVSLLTPPSSQWILQVAVLGDALADWTMAGGAYAPLGIATDARPALAATPGVNSIAWVDAGGTLSRSDFTNDGSYWGPRPAWTSDRARASGSPALARRALEPLDDPYGGHAMYGAPTVGALTAAWWEESGALVVGRALWGEPPARARITSLDTPGSNVALALHEGGRAIVAWIEDGAIWVAEESAPTPPAWQVERHAIH